MPRVKYIFPTHLYCHSCGVVVPISYQAARTVGEHAGHRCSYTRIVDDESPAIPSSGPTVVQA